LHADEEVFGHKTRTDWRDSYTMGKFT